MSARPFLCFLLIALSGACRPDSHRKAHGDPLVWQSISAGNSFTCGVAASGKTYCWGDGTKGVMGTDWILEACFDGFESYFPCSTRPIPIDGGRMERVSSASIVHTACALQADGDAICWGSNESAALGLGVDASSGYAHPHRVTGGLGLGALEAGGSHVCGLDGEGAAWCWGYNGNGQLGLGYAPEYASCIDASGSTIACEPDPVAVTGSLSFTSLTAGLRHTCGLSGGSAYCWGAGLFATGATTCQGYPCAREPQPVAAGFSFDALFSGGNTACGLTSNGRAFCWGSHPGSNGPNDGVPREVAGGRRWSSITAGNEVACGVTSDGQGFCWGEASYLGAGSSSVDSVTPVAIGGGHHWLSIDAGPTHVCGIASDGAAWCWGDNFYGQLGVGEQSGPRFEPAPVGGPFTHSY